MSLKTVSRVVNGVDTVDGDMASRVREAASKLGYRRNSAASNLKQGVRAETVGLLIADLANPFYTMIASGVEEVARERDALVVLSSSEGNPERERKALLDLCRRHVDGLLIVPTGARLDYLIPEIELGIQAVFVDRPAPSLDADAVLLDNRGGAQQAIEFLAERGHRSIAVLLDSLGIFTMAERLTGAEETAGHASRSLDLIVRTDVHTSAQARSATAELLAEESPPTAVFAGNNRIALGAYQEIAHAGRAVDLCGFDRREAFDLVHGSVMLVDYDACEMGRAAARLLFDRIDGSNGAGSVVSIPTVLRHAGLEIVASS